MKPLPCLIATAFALLLLGCSQKKEIEQIQKNLGDWRFKGIAPELKFSILKMEVKRAEYDYGHPSVSITGVIQQIGTFPVTTYSTQARVLVKVDGKQNGTTYVSSEVKNGAAPFSHTIMLDDIPASAPLPKPAAITVEIAEFTWWPLQDIRSKVTLEMPKD